jgi:hypothetical protein
MPKQTTSTPPANPALPQIDLKDRRLAAFLAWLIPGLGHIYQGRTGKGILYFVCIVGTFFYGLYLGGGHVVYASTSHVFSRQFLDRWQYICQFGVGLPALPAMVQTIRADSGKAPLGDWMRPPRTMGDFPSTDESGSVVKNADELAKWNHDSGDLFEIGTVFTVIAGLLNVLAVYDAYGGPLFVVPPEEAKITDDKKRTRDTEAKT